MTTISTRAVLVFVKVSKWDGQAYDEEASAKVNRQNSADSDASRLNKQLVDKGALKPVQQACTRLRKFVESRTVPWANDLRAVSTDNLIEFRNQVDQLVSEIQTEAVKFGRIYDAEVQAARKRLGDLFKVTDYPPVHEVVSRFRVRTKFMPLPLPKDFRASMDKELFDKMVADMERDFKEANERAAESVVERIVEVVGRMAERLTEYGKKNAKGATIGLHDTVVTNMRELIDLLPTLNLTADPRIDALRDQMRELVGNDVDALKEDANLRKQTADKAKRILDRIASMA